MLIYLVGFGRHRRYFRYHRGFRRCFGHRVSWEQLDVFPKVRETRINEKTLVVSPSMLADKKSPCAACPRDFLLNRGLSGSDVSKRNSNVSPKPLPVQSSFKE